MANHSLKTLQSVEINKPIQVEMIKGGTDLQLQVILAIVAVIATMITSVAQFGDDNGGKRLSVLASLSFSSLIISFLVHTQFLLMWVFIISAVVFLVVGLIAMCLYQKV